MEKKEAKNLEQTVKSVETCHHEINWESSTKQNAIELSLQKLTRKIFEVELLQKIADESQVTLRQRELEEIEEIRKLEEMQYKKLEIMEKFCDEIWKFSKSNDLCTVFNKYLDMPRYSDCKLVPIDIDVDPDVLKLNNEADELKMQLAEKNATCQNLQENLMELKIQLETLELYRYIDPEIIRLEKSIEESCKKVESLNLKRLKIGMRILEKNEKVKFVNGIDDEKIEFVRASELIEKSETIERKVKSKFSVKKESAILRKKSTNLRGTNMSKQ